MRQYRRTDNYMVSGIKNLNEIVFDEVIESHFYIRKIRSHLSSQLFWSGAEIVHQNNYFDINLIELQGSHSCLLPFRAQSTGQPQPHSEQKNRNLVFF